jgi:putative alpha-1,2-mannosidase
MNKNGFLVLIFLLVVHMVQAQANTDLTQFIDPFIGTKGDGNTFPGASVPYGMVKLGPDCGNKRSNSGYIPDEFGLHS